MTNRPICASHATPSENDRVTCRCGSSLFCESTQHPEMVDIVLANMNGPIDRAPQAHIYFDDRVDWVCAEDGLPRLGGQPRTR